MRGGSTCSLLKEKCWHKVPPYLCQFILLCSTEPPQHHRLHFVPCLLSLWSMMGIHMWGSVLAAFLCGGWRVCYRLMAHPEWDKALRYWMLCRQDERTRVHVCVCNSKMKTWANNKGLWSDSTLSHQLYLAIWLFLRQCHCKHADMIRQDDLLTFRPSNAAGKKGDFSDFERVVGFWWCQTGWTEYFQNCWSAGIFPHNHLQGLQRLVWKRDNIQWAAYLWIKIHHWCQRWEI